MTAGAARATRALPWVYVALAFWIPVSIAVSEPLAYLLIPLALWARFREGARVESVGRPLLYGILAFLAAAAISATLGVRPSLSWAKIDRLLLVVVILAAPMAASAHGDARDFARRVALAFILGACVQAAIDFVGLPLEHMRDTRAFEAAREAGTLAKGALAPTFYDAGNMRDPQMYMVALALLCCGFLRLREFRGRAGWWLATAILLIAFVLHFKRGAWTALVITVTMVSLLSGRRLLLLAALCVPVILLALPPVQQRLSQAREEFQLKTGGRAALWMKVAPELLREHPAGMGYRAIRNEDLQGHGVKIQKKLNHLHNNVLQVALETGRLGLAAWLWWMGAAFAGMIAAMRRESGVGDTGAALAYGVFAGFLGLHLNGVVEYNFGDGEIFLLFCLLMGLSAIIASRSARRVPAATPGHPPAS